jgi:ABC-2 type transport system permease protein
MLRYLQLYIAFLGVQWRTMLAYRVNFLIGASSTIAMQACGLMAVWVVMQQVPSLHGWTLNQILLVYGLTIWARSFEHMFAETLWTVGRQYIRPGGFDRFLVRPIDPLFHLLADRFGFDGVGEFVIGGAVTAFAASRLGVAWTLPLLLYLVLAVLSGGAIFIAINLITAVTAFWITDSLPVTHAVFQTHEFARYPLTIYSSWIRVLLTWIIPYGMVSFYPASELTGHNPGLMAWVPPMMALALLTVGYRLWVFGLRHYSGTGS